MDLNNFYSKNFFYIQLSNVCGSWIFTRKSSVPWLLLNLMEVAELGKWGLAFLFAIGSCGVHFTSLSITSCLQCTWLVFKNEPIGAYAPPLVREEVRKDDVGKVEGWRISTFTANGKS
jgi:hypothetical protein